jgi:hypothetical protein
MVRVKEFIMDKAIEQYLTQYQKYLVCSDESVLEVSSPKWGKAEVSRDYRKMVRELKADRRKLLGHAPVRARKQDRSFRFVRKDDRAFKVQPWDLIEQLLSDFGSCDYCRGCGGCTPPAPLQTAYDKYWEDYQATVTRRSTEDAASRMIAVKEGK